MIAVAFWAASASAAPVSLEYVSRVLDASGGALNGEVEVQTRLYTSEVGGLPIWTQPETRELADGFLSLQLGDVVELDDSVLRQALWVELEVDGVVQGGRQPLRSAAVAVHASSASSLGDGAVRPGEHGGLRVGNTVYGAWQASVPSSFNGAGYASGALQLQTELPCANNTGEAGYMWHIEFVGHDFRGASPFRVVSVGYSQPSYPNEIQDVSSYVDYGQVRVAAYCSTDDYLSFELTLARSGSNQWHASDLTINLLHGGSGYERRATDGFAVRATREGSRY